MSTEQLTQTVYDPTSGDMLSWSPLEGDESAQITSYALGDAAILKLGAFGSCGNPAAPDFESWRVKHLWPILENYNLTESDVFNPEVASWTPAHAPAESVHLARDAVLAVPVTNRTGSHASIMEAGFAAYGGVLRGQKVVVSIENNAESPEATRMARVLASIILRATAERYPLFTIVDDLDTLCHIAAGSLAEKKRYQASGVRVATEYTLPSTAKSLDPTIYLTGTSGAQKPEWMKKITGIIQGYGAPVDDSYRVDWSEADAKEEVEHKLNRGVQLIAITDETLSLGALGELGARLMLAQLANQSIGVYIEPHDSSPKSPTNRTRTLATAHLRRLREDFPGLPVFVAESLDQLAIFGLSEHFKQRQRLASSQN